MNANLFEALKRIVAEHGDAVLDDPKRVAGFLEDLAPHEPKPQRNALIKSLEYGFSRVLKDTAERQRLDCQLRLAQKLNAEEGLELAICEDALELLACELAIRKVFCKSCGAEIKLSGEDIVWLDGLVSEKDAELERMAAEVDEVGRINYAVTEKYEKRKIALIVAVILGVVALALFGYSAQREGNFFVVTDLNFGNADDDSQWINEPGSILTASEMRWLGLEITYNSNFDGEAVFLSRITNSYGEIMIAEGSPDGFTWRYITQLDSGVGHQFVLRWDIIAGVYSVEIWHRDVLLITREVTIYP